MQPFTVHRPNNGQDRGQELRQGAPREPTQDVALPETATRATSGGPQLRAIRRALGVDAVQMWEARQDSLRYATGELVDHLRSTHSSIPFRRIKDTLEAC